jgi:hypothetical protein
MDFCPAKSKTLFSPRRHPQTADNRPAIQNRRTRTIAHANFNLGAQKKW